MAGELSYLPSLIGDMAVNFGPSLRLALVEELEREHAIFVQDGNHGEYRPLQDEFVTHGTPFVRPANLVDGRVDLASCDRINEVAFQRVRKGIGKGGDIILTTNATIGRVAITLPSDPVFVTNPQTTIWRSTNPDVLDQHYLFCFMRSLGFQDQLQMHTGRNATFDYVSLTKQRSLTIPLPPIVEQHAIAHILGTLDDKIELNRRMNETLEAMARALFQSWFVDFDPVRAKCRGEAFAPQVHWHDSLSKANASPLPKHLADLFPDSFEDSELGEIPQGWEVGILGDVAEQLRRGVQPEEIDPATPYIALEHMPRRCIALSEWGVADGLESNKFEFKRGEILFGKLRPYFHKVGIAPVDGVCSTDIVVVTPRTQEWFGFVLGHVSSETFVEYTNAGSTGTKMPRTSWGDMARYKVVIPSEGVAKAFTSQIWPVVDHIIASIHQSRTLATLRGTLLPKLISGELRVRDAEKIAERAM